MREASTGFFPGSEAWVSDLDERRHRPPAEAAEETNARRAMLVEPAADAGEDGVQAAVVIDLKQIVTRVEARGRFGQAGAATTVGRMQFTADKVPCGSLSVRLPMLEASGSVVDDLFQRPRLLAGIPATVKRDREPSTHDRVPLVLIVQAVFQRLHRELRHVRDPATLGRHPLPST